MTRSQLASVCLAAVLSWAAAGPAAAQGQVQAALVVSGLGDPLTVAAPPGDVRLFVVERGGRIQIVKNGVIQATPFLDIHTLISQDGEGGLLGLAFPADYASSGLFTVYYTDLNHDSVVARFSVGADPDVADPSSEEQLLFIDQPDGSNFLNHKGGTIQYGPDGFLWFATGDGGGANDPFENAQNTNSLLGKLLRIDVGPDFAPDSIPVAGQPYRLPSNNPFVMVPNAGRGEIWARGLRNPFRWSFDRDTGDIWIGDVGQGAREEVDFEPLAELGGRNYGWDVMEGTTCNTADPAPAPACKAPSLVLPVYEYDHGAGDCAIIGGYVYRADSSALNGLYFFGDFCTGRVWTLDPASRAVVDRTAQLGAAGGVTSTVASFGEDGQGRLLLVQRNGRIYRLGPPPPPPSGCGLGPELALALPLLAALASRRGRSSSVTRQSRMRGARRPPR